MANNNSWIKYGNQFGTGSIRIGNVTIVKKKIKGSKSKHGISLVGIPTSYKMILDYNKVIAKYLEDDLFLKCIFKIERENLKYQKINRIYFNPETKEVSSKEYIKRTYKEYPWHCAYCNKPIISKINQITARNFTCDKCFETYIKDSKEINSKIVDSSYRFTAEIKEKILRQNKKIIKYIKRNNEK
jgi:hypothetical protein